MNIRKFIREQVELKILVKQVQEKLNKLTNYNFNLSSKNEYQYTANVPAKDLGIFSMIAKKLELLISVFNTGAENYSVTFQVFFVDKNDNKNFICYLNRLEIKNNKFHWKNNK